MFSLSAGQCGDAPEGRKLLEALAGCGWEGTRLSSAERIRETRQSNWLFDFGMEPIVPPKMQPVIPVGLLSGNL